MWTSQWTFKWFVRDVDWSGTSNNVYYFYISLKINSCSTLYGHDTNNKDKIIVESRWHNCTQLQHILCKWLWLFMGFYFLFAKINISIQLKSLICLIWWQYESSTNISFIIECTKLLTIVTTTMHSMEYALEWTFNPFISGGLFSTPLRYGMYQMHSTVFIYNGLQ